MTPNEAANVVVDTALQIHRRLGPGLLESVYTAILAHELAKRGLRVEREEPIPISWDNITLEVGFRADIVVEDSVIVEVKSVAELVPVHSKQLLTYLRLADKRLGLLINFGGRFLKDGIVRIANQLDE
jgi:GxxExxY protein